MPYIDIHSERVWIPCHPLRSMEKARAAVVNAGASMSRPAMMGRDRDWMCAGRESSLAAKPGKHQLRGEQPARIVLVLGPRVPAACAGDPAFCRDLIVMVRDLTGEQHSRIDIKNLRQSQELGGGHGLEPARAVLVFTDVRLRGADGRGQFGLRQSGDFPVSL